MSAEVGANQITLELMRWTDLGAVREIEVEVFAGSPWSAETFWAELAGVPRSRCYWVARAQGRVVGYVGLRTVPPEADIQTIAVAVDRRGRGLGGRLLRAALGEAARRRCTVVMLEVASDNESAVRLYQRNGFEPMARRSSYYGPGRDAVVMRRRQGADAPGVSS